MPKTHPWPPTKPARKLTIAQIGNFGPEHSTENHLNRALRHNGHTVQKIQENDPNAWGELGDCITGPYAVDLIIWTRTGWDWPHFGLSHDQAMSMQLLMLVMAHRAKIPVVGYHLDIWWGLKREHLVHEEPFFLVDLLVTADGGHEQNWLDAGVNHHWFPPGVSLTECELGTQRAEFRSPLAFVGSWDGGYHQEHQHRHDLVRWLQTNYKRDCAFYPKPGEHAVRGEALRDLYQSVDVVVGDSCFAGMGLSRYWSDRIPECLGRGAFLLHPWVDGLKDHFDVPGHLWTWTAGEWESLGRTIENALARPGERREVARAGREHVMKHHTYEVRVTQLVELLEERNML